MFRLRMYSQGQIRHGQWWQRSQPWILLGNNQKLVLAKVLLQIGAHLIVYCLYSALVFSLYFFMYASIMNETEKEKFLRFPLFWYKVEFKILGCCIRNFLHSQLKQSKLGCLVSQKLKWRNWQPWCLHKLCMDYSVQS